MQLSDFVNRTDQMNMKNKIANKELFEFEKKVRGKQNQVTLNFHSDLICNDLADKVWNGINYLVHVGIDYHGSAGIGGYSFATNKYDKFMDWDIFREFVNGLLITFSDYKRNEEAEQLSLFDM